MLVSSANRFHESVEYRPVKPKESEIETAVLNQLRLTNPTLDMTSRSIINKPPIHYLSCLLGSWGCRRLSLCSSEKRLDPGQVTSPDTLLHTLKHTVSPRENLTSPVHLIRTSLESGRKLYNPTQKEPPGWKRGICESRFQRYNEGLIYLCSFIHSGKMNIGSSSAFSVFIEKCTSWERGFFKRFSSCIILH